MMMVVGGWLYGRKSDKEKRKMNEKEQIRAFLSRNIDNFDSRISDSDNMFQLRLVDSLFALQLVKFIESQFSIAIESEDLEMDNFRSVNAIADMVRRKRG